MTERQSAGFVSGGVATQDAAAHPEWFLLNTSGQRFTVALLQLDLDRRRRQRPYQQKWADNVLGEIAAAGWDGVFMDDTNPTMSVATTTSPGSPSTRPTRPSRRPRARRWSRSARASAPPASSSIPNFGIRKDFPAVIKDWLRLVDGGMNEKFVKWGTTPPGRRPTTAPDYWERSSSDQGRRGRGQALPRHHALDRDRPRRRPLRLRDDAAGRRRQAAVRAAQRLHQRALVRRVRLRDRHARRRREQGRQRRPPARLLQRPRATSTRRRAPSASTSAAPTPAPA